MQYINYLFEGARKKCTLGYPEQICKQQINQAISSPYKRQRLNKIANHHCSTGLLLINARKYPLQLNIFFKLVYDC